MNTRQNPHATPAESGRFAAFALRLEEEGLSPSTQACYASDWWNVSEQVHEATGRRFRLDRFGGAGFLLHRETLAARGVSPATLNRRLAFLRRYAAAAARSEPAVVPVARSLAAVPFQTVERPPAPTLDREQELRLVAAAEAEGPRAAAAVCLLLGTGMRVCEAAALVRGDVVGRASAPTAVRVRGARAKTLLLPPRAAEALSAHLLAEPGSEADPIFRGRSGALGEDGLAALVARAAATAMVDVSPRTLRHTFAVRYLSEHHDDVPGLANALGLQSLGAARAYRGAAPADAPRPAVVRWQDLPEDEAAPRVRRRVSRDSRTEAARLEFAAGAVLPPRCVPCAQVLCVLSGRIEVTSDGVVATSSTGDVVRVPGGVRHRLRALGRTPASVLVVTSRSSRAPSSPRPPG